MKRVALTLLGILILLLPLYSSSSNVKGVTGLFEIAYPFTLSPGVAGYSFSFDHSYLERGEIDNRQLFLGMGWGAIPGLEFNAYLSYNRLRRRDFFVENPEYYFAGANEAAPGYASIGLKYNFLKVKHTGLALMVSRQYRLSGTESRVTTAKSSWGFDLLFAKRLFGCTVLAANLGTQLNRYPKEVPVDAGDFLTFAAGLETGIIKRISAVFQVVGNHYYNHSLNAGPGSRFNGIIGLNYENRNRYHNANFGLSLAYKRNLKFKNGGGVIASIRFYTGQYKDPCKLLESRLRSVVIEGESRVPPGISKSFRARAGHDLAMSAKYNPLFYTWRVSANGRINGQGSPVIDVVFTDSLTAEHSWVEVEVSNKCSSVKAVKRVTVYRQGNGTK